MAKNPSPPLLVAADTNVPLDLVADRDLVWDALHVIRERLQSGPLVVPPTVARELAFIADSGDTARDRELARLFLRNHRELNCRLVNFVPLPESVIHSAASSIRGGGLLPASETNDSLILVESAALGAAILLTSDAHFCGLDFERLSLALQPFDLSPPVMAAPREIVRRFFR
jgi:hypothetical protein